MLGASMRKAACCRTSRAAASPVNAAAAAGGRRHPRLAAAPPTPRGVAQRRQHQPWRAAASRADDDVLPVPPAPLATSDEPEALQSDADWIAGMVQLWLDEEWCPQEVHGRLGRAAGDAYARIRAGGEDEMGGLLLALSGELAGFGYRECFVGPFDVANKVVEMLMQREGTDVCCTSDDDASRAQRLAERRQSE